MRVRHALLIAAGSLWLAATAAAAAANLAGFEPGGSGDGYPEAANGRLTPRPSVRALPANGDAINLDGKLDEPVWRTAEAATGFTQMEPERGSLPSEETVFKVIYDEDAIYFGVACYENDVSKTSSCLSRRDQIANSDIVSIYIDPYHDKTTGYNFRVNPLGVLADAYIFDDGDRDWDWDAVWEAETWSDADGWYAEVRIPFSSIRYRPASSMTWGLQVYRWMHGRGEDTGWVHWEREVRGFVSRFGELTDIQGIRPPRRLEILPYAVLRGTDPAATGEADRWDTFQNFGADIKYGVTADLTLNATFQPDFGQVEADPSLLNLSPFETFYEEKRPFFIEGARFFEHPDFNLFYSRRIGTGGENARIRFAGKLTGKTASNISVAVLFAATDRTEEGQAHNPLRNGTDQTYFAVARFGKEFADGNHRVNVMQTAVLRAEESRWAGEDLVMERDAYSSGLDFDLNFKDRMYNVRGSFVGTIVDPTPVANDPSVEHDPRYGTGGQFELRKLGGHWRGAVQGRWESDKLDPNDLGFLRAPDEIISDAWLQYRYDSDEEKDALFNQGQVNLNYHRSWLYAGSTVADAADPERTLWSYGSGHPQAQGWNVNSWWQTRGFWSLFTGAWHDLAGTSKYRTRTYAGNRGPLMTSPESYGTWLGVNTDWRKDFWTEWVVNLHSSDVGSRGFSTHASVRWVQGTRVNHNISLGFNKSHSDAQWVGNFENPGGGIGDISYVFGELEQRTWDVTLRTSVLFSRNQSLEIYAQPFLTVGSYRNAKELLRPASYDLGPYTAGDFDISQSDFSFGAVNLNMVYRWEYRSGSTVYLVWTHSRSRYEERGFFTDPDRFSNDFSTTPLFRNEPENTLLVKISYWFSL